MFVATVGTERVFRYRPGLLGNRRERGKLENNAQERSGYLRPGLVSVPGALVLVVLTLAYCISVKSMKQKEVNLRKSGARLRVAAHHCPVRGKSKRRTNGIGCPYSTANAYL